MPLTANALKSTVKADVDEPSINAAFKGVCKDILVFAGWSDSTKWVA